jgi:hypothetical protein
MVPTIYFFNKLSKIFLSPKLSRIATLVFVVLTSIPFFEGNIANAEVFMLLPTILAVILFYKAKKPTHYLIPAILLGFAFTIKIPVAFEFLFLFVYMIIEKLELTENTDLKKIFLKLKSNFASFVYFVVGFLIPITLWGIYFYFNGAFKPFITASLLQNFGYLSSWSTGNQTSSATAGGLPLRFVLLLISWAVFFVFYRKKNIDSKSAFLLFWFSAVIFSVLLSGRPYPHYLIQLLPALILVVLSLFSKKIFNTSKALISLSLLVLVLVIVKYNFYFYPVFSYYGNFYSYALHFKTKEKYNEYFSYRVNENYRIADFINKNSKDNSKIFVWGDEPYLYPLTNRLPVGRFTVAYHVADFNAYQEIANQLKMYLPEFIVYYPMNNRPFQELDNLIEKYYYPELVVNSTIVYKLR